MASWLIGEWSALTQCAESTIGGVPSGGLGAETGGLGRSAGLGSPHAIHIVVDVKTSATPARRMHPIGPSRDTQTPPASETLR